MINDDLFYFGNEFASKEELLSMIADKLHLKGYVNSLYKEKIIEREQKYPTGLKLDGLNIAICHAEPEFAKEDTVYAIKPKRPVAFTNAETMEAIDVDLVIGLVFTTGPKHLDVLKKIATLLLDKEIIKRINEMENRQELITFFKEYFGEA